MALSDFTGPDYIDAWTKDLDRRWPERSAMVDCVVRTLGGWQDERRERDLRLRDLRQAGSREKKRHAVIRLLELGVGAGGLAEAVLDALADASGEGSPDAVEYTGIDIEPALVSHGEARLIAAGHQDTHLIRADLKDGNWICGNGPFDAVYSLQTLHDLGGVEALETVYRQTHGLLAPGGILVNADFVVPFEKDDPERPRRLPVETHQDLLSSLGYVDFKCELLQGKMACMSARRP